MPATNVNRYYVLRAHPVGDVKPSDISLELAPIPTPSPGQVLVKNLYVSIDPTHRIWMSEGPGYMPHLKIGDSLRALTVGEVLESKSDKFRQGDIVTSIAGGVQEYYVADDSSVNAAFDSKNVSANMSVYSLLMGHTAWVGTVKVAQVKQGDTFVVSAAAGAVGSVAGQIAKSRGARVIGIVGSQAKADWITKDLGFDAAINYKTENVAQRLAELAPNGVHSYFENVGGEILDAVLSNLANNARVAVCGLIEGYNKGPKGVEAFVFVLLRRATVQGFICTDHLNSMGEAFTELSAMVKAGTLKWKEQIEDGLENYLPTLQMLFDGRNDGKLLLKVN
eukprot:comp21928_c0_seq1/m.31549 comp21928_c0_seq1/g.31549  ORF comp21928_c0_seq1/g.31549 comp21928_c0_seq1/m.31549 type:complete len:336 (-) comp21928_c0_seq1:370-1377(-)